MARLCDIPIRIEHNTASGAGHSRISAAVLAILHEVQEMLEQYQAFGQHGSIDLRWLSLLPGDIDQLRDVLGDGEVTAQVNALGASSARETAIACVWWVEHGGPDGESLGTWIEVTEAPALLRSDRASIPYGLDTLRDRLVSFGGARDQAPPPFAPGEANDL